MLASVPKLTLWHFGTAPVRVDATFLITPVFIFVLLSNWPMADLWPVVVAFTASIFLSVLFHELGHATLARHYKVAMKEIVVGGFFGYVTLKRQAVPRAWRIGILAAGPAANLLLFLAFWLALPTFSLFPPIIPASAMAHGTAAEWLQATLQLSAVINLLMFVGNLIPMFPLDGGRICFHALGMVLPDRTSTMATASIGILSGLVVIYLAAGFSVILVLFAAWFGLFNIRVLLSNLKHRPRKRRDQSRQ